MTPSDSQMGGDRALSGSLSIVRPTANDGNGPAFEVFIKITADGSVMAFNGHVDLGTGIRTALGQIVAEELDVSFARVIVVLGDTARVPIRARPSPARPSRLPRCPCARRPRRRVTFSWHVPQKSSICRRAN